MKQSKIQIAFKKMLDDEKHLKSQDIREAFAHGFLLAGLAIVISGFLFKISILWILCGFLCLIFSKTLHNKIEIANIKHILKYKEKEDD